jgi:hypothetical protein
MSTETPPIGADPSFVFVKVCSTAKVCACATWPVITIHARVSKKARATGLVVLPTVNQELLAGFVMMASFTK